MRLSNIVHGEPVAVVVALLLQLPARAASSPDSASFQGLGFLYSNFPYSEAFAISADGEYIVGRSQIDPSQQMQAFRWSVGHGMQRINFIPGGSHSEASAASFDGSVIVGMCRNANNQLRAYRWSEPTGSVDLGVLPNANLSNAFGVSQDGSIVVGYCGFFNGTKAFRWTASDGMLQLPALGGCSDARAWGISGEALPSLDTPIQQVHA